MDALKLTGEQEKRIEATSARIEDPELRMRFIEAMSAHLAVGNGKKAKERRYMSGKLQA